MLPSGQKEGASGGCAAERCAPAALPCLNSNISIQGAIPEGYAEAYRQLTTNHRKTAYKLGLSVKRLCDRYGVERVGFLTLTFADHVTCAREAGRRYNSLRTNVLAGRYVESICVLERMKSGRIHFHLLVVLGVDIRTGFNFEQAAAGVYTSANAELRGEWAFWRGAAREYGFGRTELLPVKSNAEGLHKYVGKYIAKHVGQREQRDKGVRLVRYSRGASVGSSAFMFASQRSRLWRSQVQIFAQRNGCADLAQLRDKFGARWAYVQRVAIMSIEPREGVVCHVEDGEPVTLRELWARDRMERAAAIAEATGETSGDVFMALYQPERVARISCDVPRWKLPETEGADFSDEAWARAGAVLAREVATEAARLESLDEDGERVDRLTWMKGEPDGEGVGCRVDVTPRGSAARR